MAITKGSTISILCGSLIGIFIGARPFINNTLDMFVQEMALEYGGVTYKHGNFIKATIDRVCQNFNMTDNCNQTTWNTNGTCAQINCTLNINVDYPPVAKFIEWTNILPSLLCLGVCMTFIMREVRVEVLLVLWFLIGALMFSNYVLYATLVGSAVGFTSSDLTVPFCVCATVSALFMMFPLIMAVWSIIIKILNRPQSSMVRVRYKELNDPEIGFSRMPTDKKASTQDVEVVKDQIRCMVHSLWTKDNHNVGIGKDADGLIHAGIQVKRIRTVTNNDVWDRYNNARNRIAAFAASVGGKLKGLKEYPGIRIESDTVPSPLSEFVEHSVNEYYLFHGTQISHAESIVQEGFNVDKSRRTMLGRGIYFSDSFVKADQYTRPDEEGMCCVIMAKVLLGDFIVTLNTSSIPSTAQQPPCKKCLKTDCKGKHKKGRPRYDSVVYTGGLFREYIIFDNWQAYPEYIIYYKRV